MPSTPSRWTLPKLSLISLSCGHGLERHLRIAALDLDGERLAGADADDALHVGEAVDLARHRSPATRSPGWKPAAAAALSGLHGIDPRARGLLADRS